MNNPCLFFSGRHRSDASGQDYYAGRASSEFLTPARTIMLAERPTVGNIYGAGDAAEVSSVADPTNAPQLKPAPDGVSEAYHTGGFNYLFVDGHVKWQRPDKTIGVTPCWFYSPTVMGGACGEWLIDNPDN